MTNDRNVSSRRNFLGGTAASGLLSALSLEPGMAVAAAQQPQESEAVDPQAPPTLRPKAEVDGRFTVSHKESVPRSLRLISEYFAALSQRDLGSMADLMHYPFMTHEGPEAMLIETKDQLLAAPPLSMNVTGKGDSKIKPGAYDILDSIQVHIYSPVGAGLTMQYSRFDPTGEKLLECHGMYGITNNDGKWGIEWASTIFKPANQVQRDDWYNFPIANYAMHESHRDHVMARRYTDNVELRRTVFDPYPHGSLSLGGSGTNSANARAGKPMDDYKIVGVKNRLRFSKGDTPMPEQQVNQMSSASMNRFATESGAGVGVWALSIETPDTRTLYSSAEKAHFYCGYFRYTQDGSIISEKRYLCALVNWKGTWYGNDTSRVVGHVMYQDRTNDLAS